MLTIRDEQMQILGAEMERSFLERLTGTIASLFPVKAQPIVQNAETPQPAPDYRGLVSRAVERAEHFGIDKENDIAAFVILAMATRSANGASGNFLNWTHPIIVSDDIAASAKMPLIEHRLQAEATADPDSARVLEMIRSVRVSA